MTAARIVHTVHWVFLLFVLTGWLLPWPVALITHMIVIPGLIVHWRTNENRCILTEMEERLKNAQGASNNAAEPVPEEPAAEGQFIKGAWAKAYGKEPSDELLSRVIYGAMILVWIFSLTHLIWFK